MPPHQRVGRYLLYDVIAAGGMASVRVGKLVSQIGVGRIVAIKCLHPVYAEDPSFVEMLVDEASLALRLRHPNIVPTLDVVAQDGKLFIVMEYVHGASAGGLWKKSNARGKNIPVPITARIMVNALEGLHAAHEACSPAGEPLGIVHRDVSPQNIMVGVDGISRVLDFGIAKAAGRSQSTQDGQVKGKLSYISPEQIRGEAVDRRVDVFSAGVVLWEMLTGQRLLEADGVAGIVGAVLFKEIPRPSTINSTVSIELDAIALRALSKDPDARFATARAMSEAIENATLLASDRVVSAFVKECFDAELKERATLIATIESETVAAGSLLESEPAPPMSQTTPLARSGSSPGFRAESRSLTPPLGMIEPALSR